MDPEKHKIRLVLKVTASYLYGKNGIEMRVWSLSEDNTHYKVRISHGSNQFVMVSDNNDTEVPEDKPEEQALQLNVKGCPCRSKAKAKPRRTELAGFSPRKVPIERRTGTDLEPDKYSFTDYEVSKKVMYLQREDGAVHFWRI